MFAPVPKVPLGAIARGLTVVDILRAPTNERGFKVADAVIGEGLSFVFKAPGTAAGIAFNHLGGTKSLARPK